jgi:osmoprotectant transport system permease protein
MDSLLRHIMLVAASVGIGVVVSIPLGIFLTRHQRLAAPVLAFAGMIQTIPGLVMLGFALLLFGIGELPALVVLSLYAILPILRNTYTGILGVENGYIEEARGIGMTNLQILFQVELPLSMPSIVSGIRISAVYIVSWATLAGLIGAGGLGDLIWTGLSTYNTGIFWRAQYHQRYLPFLSAALWGFCREPLRRGLEGRARMSTLLPLIIEHMFIVAIATAISVVLGIALGVAPTGCAIWIP